MAKVSSKKDNIANEKKKSITKEGVKTNKKTKNIYCKCFKGGNGRNTEMFSAVIIGIQLSLSLFTILYDRYGILRDSCMLSVLGVQLYMLLLAWATSLPEGTASEQRIHRFRFKLSVSIACIGALIYMIYSILRGSIINAVICFIIYVVSCFSFYKLLYTITFILRKEYADTQSLSKRILAKLLGAIPFVIYFFSQALEANTGRFFVIDEACYYVPGAYKNYGSKRNIFSESEKYFWENCSGVHEMDEKIYPSHPTNTQESILKHNMARYREYDAQRVLARLELQQLCILYLSNQILFRIRRLTIDDVLVLNINKIELVFILQILLQLCVLLFISSLSMETQTLSSFKSVLDNCTTFYLILFAIWQILVIYVVQDTNRKLNKIKNSDNQAILVNNIEDENLTKQRRGSGFSSRKRRASAITIANVAENNDDIIDNI